MQPPTLNCTSYMAIFFLTGFAGRIVAVPRGCGAPPKRAQGRAWLGAPVESRVHFKYSSNSRLRSAGASVGDPGGLLMRRNSSKLLCTRAVCSRRFLSIHWSAAGKRCHPVRASAKFTSPHFGCRSGAVSADSAPKNAGTNCAILRLDSSDFAVLFATSTALMDNVSMVCSSGISAG